MKLTTYTSYPIGTIILWLVPALLLAVVSLAPELAYAGTNTTMGNVMCTVLKWMKGNTGKGLEVIAMTTLGISALLGKITWGTAMLEGIGCAIIFGAGSLVETMGAGAPMGCPTA